MKLLVLLCALFMLPSAFAYDYNKKIGIGADLGYDFPVGGNKFNDAADNDFGYGVHAYYHFTSAWGLAGSFRRLDFDDVPQRAQVFDLLGFYRLKALARFTPVFGLGIGGVDLRDENNIHLGLRARIGAEYSICPTWSVALNGDYQEVRQMPGADMPNPSNVHAIVPSLALTYYFGSEKSQAVANTVKEEVKEEVKQVMDSDNDGVNDMDDKCPSTPEDTKVNAYGCAEDEKATISLNVEFETGKSVVRDQYASQLQAVADFMKAHPNTKAAIEGHTDNVGSLKGNMNISTKRAEAVKAYLIGKFGIDKARLTAEGFGPNKPIADNNTAEGKAKNRRVVAVFTE